jgi:serine/threonine-protein kinase HipA
MAFNVMARNCDDHTKNHAFRLKQGGRWELAPAFDVTHAHNPNGEWTYQHLMSVNGKFDGIGRDDLMAVAKRFGVVGARDTLVQVRDAVGRWLEFADMAKLPESESNAVAKDHCPM